MKKAFRLQYNHCFICIMHTISVNKHSFNYSKTLMVSSKLHLRNHDFKKTHDTFTAKYVKDNVVYANAPI